MKRYAPTLLDPGDGSPPRAVMMPSVDGSYYLVSEVEASIVHVGELEAELAMANDAAAKGDLARANAGGMEMRIAELEYAMDKVSLAHGDAQSVIARYEKEFGKMEMRIQELETALLDARVLMRDLWRLDPIELPSEELATRCKTFMGGG